MAKKYNIKGPLTFSGYLNNYPKHIQNAFKPYILNYQCLLLNVHDLDFNTNPLCDPLEPALFIMQNIYQLNQQIIEKFFTLGQNMIPKNRQRIIEQTTDYIRNIDPNSSWNILEIAEQKNQPNKEKNIMPLLSITKQKERQQGHKEGRQEGLEYAALKLLRKGMTIKEIADTLELPLQKLQKLKT